MASNLQHRILPAVGPSIALPTAPAATRIAWRHAIAALALVIAWILVCYASTALAMAQIWLRSETFAHGMVVVPIVLWLVWRQRTELARMTPHRAAWVLAPLALAGLAWMLGRLAEVNALAQLSMTAMIVLAVPAVLGLRVARALMFPLGFLFFAVPIGDFILPVLMNWTADFTIAALRASGIPVYREGLMFVIPSGTWSVIEACSGVRYLIASLMVGTLYAYLSYRSNRRRWLFVGVAIAVAIVANWLRAYLIVLLGHLSGNRLAVGVDHIIYGWVFFGIIITLMFWIGGRWREDIVDAAANASAAPVSVQSSSSAEAASAAAAMPEAPAARASHFWAVALGAIVVSSVFPAAQSRLDAADDVGPVQLAAVMPAGDWKLANGSLSSWHPVFERPSAVFDGHAVGKSQVVGLYIAYYRNQDSTHKLVSSNNVLVRSEDRVWRRVAGASGGGVMIGDAEVAPTGAELVSGGGERLVAWKFYWIDGRLIDNDYLAKLYTAWGRLRNGRDDAAAIVVYVSGDDAKAAAPKLQAFLREEGPAIVAALVATREHR